MAWLGPLVTRFYRHLTRPRAVAAWAIAFVTIVIDFNIGGETLHELAAVVVGVLTSFALLPDPAGDVENAAARATVWLQRPDLLRDVVSPSRLRDAARDVLESVQPGRGQLAWVHGAAPIVDAPPEAIYDEFSYNITLRRGSGATEGWYEVETSCSAVRTFSANQERLWASFVRTLPELESEYSNYSCLNREIVPGDAWNKGVETGWLTASLRVGNREVVGVREDADRVLRVTFDANVSAGVPVHLTVRARFLLPLSDQSFPVKMESYFCRGRAQVDFDIRDPGACDVDAFVSAPGLRASSTNLLRQLQGEAQGEQKWRIETPADGLLFPGSGVMWTWRHAR